MIPDVALASAYAVAFLACHLANGGAAPDAWRMAFSATAALAACADLGAARWLALGLRVWIDVRNFRSPRSRAVTLAPASVAQGATLLRVAVYWSLAARAAAVPGAAGARVVWHFLAVNALRIVHAPWHERDVRRRAAGGLGDLFQLYAAACVGLLARADDAPGALGVLFTASYMLGVRYPGGYCSPATAQTGALGLWALRAASAHLAAATLERPWLSLPAYALGFLPHSDPARQRGWHLHDACPWLFRDKLLDDAAFLLWPAAFYGLGGGGWQAAALFIRSQPTVVKHRKSACAFDHDAELPFAPRMLLASTFHHWVGVYTFSRGGFANALAVLSWSLGHPTFWAMRVRRRGAAWGLLAVHACHVAMTTAGTAAWRRDETLGALPRSLVAAGLVYRMTWWAWTCELFARAAAGRVAKPARDALDFSLPAFSPAMCAAHAAGALALLAGHARALLTAV
jgi:hypothetical protein